jgi:RNA polymerase sigma factor (sigma-70 family)
MNMRRRIESGEAEGGASDPKAPASLAALAFEQFRGGLYRYLLRRLRNAENAEDLSQEVYLRLLRAVDLSQVKCPQAYVYRVAFHVLYEFKLREKSARVAFDSEVVAELADRLPDEAVAPEEAYEDGAQERRLKEVIERLPPMQRAVLRLAAQGDLPHADIAQRLGISVSTVRNHLYQAVRRCRLELKEPE